MESVFTIQSISQDVEEISRILLHKANLYQETSDELLRRWDDTRASNYLTSHQVALNEVIIQAVEHLQKSTEYLNDVHQEIILAEEFMSQALIFIRSLQELMDHAAVIQQRSQDFSEQANNSINSANYATGDAEYIISNLGTLPI